MRGESEYHAAMRGWVANTIADIVDTQGLYWSGPGRKLVPTLTLCRMVACQVANDSKEQALARFSGLFADELTVFH